MSKITLQSITLSFFKGIKSLHLDLNEDINSIYADNGCGKTTISDAFMWCLFGKNTEGRTDFGIKTLDTLGNVIPNVEHSVTLSLIINDTKRDIKRQWVEERVTRRGVITDEVKHHTEFYVDGMAYTKKDFDLFISSIISEQVFRIVTNPLHFLSLPWKEQRSFLQDMTGNIDTSSLSADERFESILHNEQFKDIEEYLQHLRYNIRQVKDKIESIPARIEEQTRTCPPLQDWDALSAQLTEFGQSINTDKETLSSLRHGSESASRRLLRDKIEHTEKRIDIMRQSASRMSTEDYNTYHVQTAQLQDELLNERQVLAGLQARLKSDETLLAQYKQSLIDINRQKAQCKTEYAECYRSRFVPPASPECPLCHRPFSGDDYTKEVNLLREVFNTNKATTLQKLEKQAKEISENLASVEASIKTYVESSSTTRLNIEECELRLKNIENRIKAHNENTPPTAEQRLLDNPSYKQATEELANLNLRLSEDVATDNSEAIANLTSSINDKQNRYNEILAEFGKKETYEAHQKRITELNEEQSTLNTQLDELLHKKDIAEEYQFAVNDLIEKAVNSHFQYVRFQLFDTLNDGTRKPNCIASVKGVPYSDLNSSAKLNAGRDVLNALAKYYDIYAPVFSDNAEGTNTFLPIHSQDIRLYVSHDKQLTLK